MHPLVQRIGLTGGIGSGKSTAGQVLVNCGAVLIDADAISRQLTNVSGTAIEPIQARFGMHAITPQGAMNRDVIRELIFSCPKAKFDLEAIIHPLVLLETSRQTDAALLGGARCLVFDIPLLAESIYWRSRLDQILVVDCTIDTQIRRVMERSGWTKEAVQKVITAQASRAKRREIADVCIYNDSLSLSAFDQLIRQIACLFGL